MTTPPRQAVATKKPNRRRSTKTSLKHLSAPEKRALVDKHAERVRKADEAMNGSGWALADELAALAETYKQCHGHPIKAKKLQTITGIDRDGSRLALYSKLAKVFPKEARLPAVGLRVYETAYKFNQSLIRQGRDPLSVEDLCKQIKGGRSAFVTREFLEGDVQQRDKDLRLSERLVARDAALTKPKSVMENKKTWLKMIEDAPFHAIGAAIATVLPKTKSVHYINETLERLGCQYYLAFDDPSQQIYPYDEVSSSQE